MDVAQGLDLLDRQPLADEAPLHLDHHAVRNVFKQAAEETAQRLAVGAPVDLARSNPRSASFWAARLSMSSDLDARR